MLGLAYKRNTGDARESPSQPICADLAALGAEVRAADPHVRPGQEPDGVTRVELTADELRAADAVIVLVDHSDFDRELVTEHARYVLDCRRWLPKADNVEHL